MFSNSVLIVEDDPGLNRLVQMVLRAQGFEVLAATTAAEALRLWQEAGRAVAVALIDLNLPGGVRGDELAQRLKAENPSLAIIITSGGIRWFGKLPAALQEFSFLPKPFLPSQLLRVIREVAPDGQVIWTRQSGDFGPLVEA